MDPITGAWDGRRYKHVESINFISYMKAVGIRFFAIKLSQIFLPEIELRREDEGFVYKEDYKVDTIIRHFRTNEKLVETMPKYDERKVPTIYYFEGPNKLIQEQIFDGKISAVVSREFSDSECIVTLRVKNITAIRRFVAIDSHQGQGKK